MNKGIKNVVIKGKQEKSYGQNQYTYVYVHAVECICTNTMILTLGYTQFRNSLKRYRYLRMQKSTKF
jgi:hypothetical protein